MLEPDDRLTERFATGEATALVGTTIAGKYEISSLIAKGGMGAVYKAVQQPLGRVVAVKVLHIGDREPAVVAEFRERFVREAAAVARLKNPHTVTLHDYGQLDDSDDMFMALEYVRGRTLRDVLKDEGRLSVVRTLTIAIQVARSLREAHRVGVIHRDLKPSNIMLADADDGGEFVKVVDFGLAKGVESDTVQTGTTPLPGELNGVLGVNERTLTARGVVIGSPGYISPEQIRDEPMDHRADIYTLGCVMFECLAGAVPFRGRTKIDAYLKQVQGEVPRIYEVNAEVVVPDEVEALILKCLSRQPVDRYPDAGELITALQACLPPADLGDAFLPVGPSATGSHTGPQTRPSPVVAAALVAAGVVVGVLLGLLVPDGTGTVRVVTVPPGAEVWEGENMLGASPLDLEGGETRTLRIEHAGHQPRTITIDAAPGNQYLFLELRPSGP